MKRLAVLAVFAILAGMAVGLTGCNGYPNDPNGNSAGLALYEATPAANGGPSPAWDRQTNPPPWALPNANDCWNFVNYVELHADNGNPTAGYVAVQSQGQFGAYLQPDGFGVNPGDIVTFAINGQPQTAVHTGIVTIVSPGDFSYVSWNSGADPNHVVILQHVYSTAPDVDGLTLMNSFVP
jgi:hypothetical protein